MKSNKKKNIPFQFTACHIYTLTSLASASYHVNYKDLMKTDEVITCKIISFLRLKQRNCNIVLS